MHAARRRRTVAPRRRRNVASGSGQSCISFPFSNPGRRNVPVVSARTYYLRMKLSTLSFSYSVWRRSTMRVLIRATSDSMRSVSRGVNP